MSGELPEKFLRRLARLLGPGRILRRERIPPFYFLDMLRWNRGFPTPPAGWPPAGVVRPRSTREVSAVLSEANRSGHRLVCWGGGTNLMGSAAALGGEIILDLGALSRVVRIDRPSRRAYVQAGATIQDVERRAGARGLFLGHDPWTVASATVGGSISTDGIGYLYPRCGSMGEMVLGATLVLADGSVAVRRPVERSPGIDLSHLVTGLEGTLAVLTEAVLRLRPLPPRRELRAYRFRDFASGLPAVLAAYELGPSVIDFIEPFEEGSRLLSAGVDGAGPTLYLGFEGARSVVAAQHRESARIAAASGGSPRRPSVARKYWEDRHAIGDWVAKDAASRSRADEFGRRLWFEYLHVALPFASIRGFRSQALKIAARRGVFPTEIGLFGHPELLNFYFLAPRRLGDESGRVSIEAALEDLIALAHRNGGSMEYCHGVGARLSRFLEREFGVGLGVYDRIKAALDPRGVLPTLGRRPRPESGSQATSPPRP